MFKLGFCFSLSAQRYENSSFGLSEFPFQQFHFRLNHILSFEKEQPETEMVGFSFDREMDVRIMCKIYERRDLFYLHFKFIQN